MKFFDVKQTGDILQRIHDHERVEYFLTGKTLNAFFSFLTFLIFSGVLFVYSIKIFTVFIIGSVLYGLWTVAFLKRRKVLDYITFSKQAEVNNRTYQFVTSVQEIKLQNCKLRRRKEWEQSEKIAEVGTHESLSEKRGIYFNLVKNQLELGG